jgi:hypothetical protein
MIVLIDKNNVIIDIVESAQTVENGLQVTKNKQTYIYASVLSKDFSQIEKDNIPDGVNAQAYKLVEGEYVVNPDYVAPKYYNTTRF